MPKMISDLDETFLIAADVTTPLASISKRNFIRHEIVEGGKMTIFFKVLRSPFPDVWETRSVTFDIEPLNAHALRNVLRWTDQEMGATSKS